MDVSGNIDVGGLVGHNYDNATISNSYATGSVSGSSGVGGTGLNTSEMQGSSASSNMSSFDFSSIWTTQTSPADYPELQNNRE